MDIALDPIEHAVDEVAAGRPVVVVDDSAREDEADLVFAASAATAAMMAFMVRHTSGVVCVPLTGAALDRLGLPPMTPDNQDPLRTAWAVSVDARDGITTGISAADRARTARLLSDPDTEPAALVRPGHMFPLRAQPGGVLRRAGHTEAAVDLAVLAGRSPAGVIAELICDDGTMRRGAELRSFADRHELPVVSVADLAAYRWQHERLVTQVASTRLPTQLGVFRGYGYRSDVDGSEHLALVHGDLGDGREILTRLHSECLTGDVFGSRRCDCGSQLEASLAAITAAGAGVVVYLRGHEGRGIGLLHKLQAYALQDSGRDTVDANLDLGLPADARHYGTGAQILRHLGVRSVLLLSNNPAKAHALQRLGVGVTERRPLTTSPTPDNLRYLRTKAARLGHDLPALQDLLGGPGTVPAGEPL